MSGRAQPGQSAHIPGFLVPIHGALGSPILLGGAPRAIAIINGTLGAAIGLGMQMWLTGLICWAMGHSLAVFAARHDPDFAPVFLRHIRQKEYLAC